MFWSQLTSSLAKSSYEDVFKDDSEYISPDNVAYALDAAVRRFQHEVKDPMGWAPHIDLGI
jgi:hypothetical protein